LACPLCHSLQIETVENLTVLDIVSLYSNYFDMDVTKIFGEIESINFCHCTKCDLFFFDPMVVGNEEFYSKLQNFNWYYMEEKNEYEYAASLITENDSVLEIGSGKGAFAKLITAQNYVGLEFSQSAQIMAASNGIKLLNQSIQEHALEYPGEYDVVCSFQVLEHVSNPRSFIEAAVDCIRPGGKLIISVPSLDSFYRYVKNNSLDMPPHHVTRWTDQALLNLAREVNIVIESIWHEPLQDIHKQLYSSIIFRNSISRVFNLPPALIKRTFFERVLGKISSLAGKFYSRGLNNNFVLPRGVSVTAVYTKP